MDEKHSKTAIEAFDMMWENYPSPVMLITKKQVIVSLNKVARDLGLASVTNCHTLSGNDSRCPGCKAPLALKEKTGQRSVAYNELTNGIKDSYWIPVNSSDDLYIHFANDITAYAKPEMFPQDK